VTKLSDRALPVVFLGYEPGSKAYRVVYPVQHRLYVTRDVVFEEDRKWNRENKGQSQEFVEVCSRFSYYHHCCNTSVFIYIKH
jgi:hypothetical protein